MESSGSESLETGFPQPHASENAFSAVTKLGSNLQLACDRQCGNLPFSSPKEFSSIIKSLIQYVNKISY